MLRYFTGKVKTLTCWWCYRKSHPFMAFHLVVVKMSKSSKSQKCQPVALREQADIAIPRAVQMI